MTDKEMEQFKRMTARIRQKLDDQVENLAQINPGVRVGYALVMFDFHDADNMTFATNVAEEDAITIEKLTRKTLQRWRKALGRQCSICGGLASWCGHGR